MNLAKGFLLWPCKIAQNQCNQSLAIKAKENNARILSPTTFEFKTALIVDTDRKKQID